MNNAAEGAMKKTSIKPVFAPAEAKATTGLQC